MIEKISRFFIFSFIFKIQSSLCINPKIVTVAKRWSLFRGHLSNKIPKWDPKIVVVMGRGLLFGGGRELRFDSI